MAVNLIIERARDCSESIGIEKWKRLMADDPELRLRMEPYCAVNPSTGDRIVIPIGEADAELRCGDEREPFLWFSDGRLRTNYRAEFDDARDPRRAKLASIARQLGAVIRLDERPLDW